MVRLALVLLLAGCTPQTIYKPVPLEVPARPMLPRIAPESLECVSDETYSDLVNRDRALKTHVEELEAIIQATH